MPALTKAAVASGIASFLAALTVSIIGLRRSLRFEPPLDARQLDAMQYHDAMVYMTAHSRHVSMWEALVSIATMPIFWLEIAKIAACGRIASSETLLRGVVASREMSPLRLPIRRPRWTPSSAALHEFN